MNPNEHSSNEVSIEVNDLSFSYPTCSVLRHASFKIGMNQFIGIIGPNGGGKSTLLNLLMGFLKPQRGTIFLDGQEVKQTVQAAHRIGFVAQHFHYDRQFPISALEVVLMGRLLSAPHLGRYSRKDRLIAYAMLERVGMQSYSNALFSELSGGQAQRVLIARALASNPKFLFLDEAVANVDASTQDSVYKLLKELKTQMTILLVTHDLHSALSHVDELLLVQGKTDLLSKEAVCEHFALGLYHPPIELNRRPL